MKTSSNSFVKSPSVENSTELEHGIAEGFVIDPEDDDFTSLLDIKDKYYALVEAVRDYLNHPSMDGKPCRQENGDGWLSWLARRKHYERFQWQFVACCTSFGTT